MKIRKLAYVMLILLILFPMRPTLNLQAQAEEMEKMRIYREGDSFKAILYSDDMVVFGNATSFIPDLLLNRWGNECWFKMGFSSDLLAEVEDEILEFDELEQIVRWKTKLKFGPFWFDLFEIHFYLFEPRNVTLQVNNQTHAFRQMELGGVEYEVILHEEGGSLVKLLNYTLIFPFQAEGLNFYYQPPLANHTWEDLDGDGVADSFRPENVVGSTP